MARLSRRGFTTGAIALVSGACGGLTATDGSSEPAGEPPGKPVEPHFGTGPEPSPTRDPELLFGPVTTDAAPPSVIWSWTTEEQAAEIRRAKVLFTRESSPTLGRGYLFDVLAARAAEGDIVASRLAGSELAKGRFGWSNPWATVRGATLGETYGLELLKIEMRAETWFARVRTSTPAILFVDAAGKPIASPTALASFDRVGGILFENDAETITPCSTGSGGGGMIYREIYVGNESRVATFSHRTAAILSVLNGHIAELSAFGVWLRALGLLSQASFWNCRASEMWTGPSSNSFDRYIASLAFANEPYGPDAATIDSLVAELKKARFTPDPFTHSP